MNRKKQVISAALSLLLSTGISAGSILPTFAAEKDGPDVTANEEQKGVAIDEKNFPDETFRSYVKENFDSDDDGYLSDEEINHVDSLNLYADDCRNIEGAEIFKNLEYLDVSYTNIQTIDRKILIGLNTLDAQGTQIESIDLSLCKKLSIVRLSECLNLQKVNLSGCEQLTEASLYSCKNLKDINLTGSKERLEELNLGACTNLKDVDLTGSKELKYLRLDGCEHMRDIDVETLKNQTSKMISLGLNATSESMVDLTGYKLNSFYLDDGSVESIKFDSKSSLYYIDIGHNDIKELDLEGVIYVPLPWSDEYGDDDTEIQIYIQRQTPTITITEDKVKNNTVALSDLFSDVSRVTIKKGSGYTYDDAKKAVTFKSTKNMKFNYVWDTKYESEKLYGTANIVVEDVPKPSQPETKINTITQVKLAATKYTYDGKDKTPAVTAYDGTTKLDNSVYTVTYPTSRKNIGAYTVKVTGKADKNCKGTVTATYQIVPKTVNTPTVKAGKKKVAVKWSKTTGGVKYQLAIAKKGSAYKNYTVTGTSKTIKKLTSKKNYQVKVRAYKKVGTKTYYGGWSKIKTVKVK